MESAGFSVENKKLLYNGKLIGASATLPGFPQFDFEENALGEGANGVTFRVQHRTLRVDQVVKLYSPEKAGVAEKALLEAQKNADPRVRDVIAQVHDAGTYRYPEEISYSVMESVSGIQTLKEWLAERDERWESAQTSLDSDYGSDKAGAHMAKNHRHRLVMAEALNVAAGFVGAVARVHAAGVIHGDLNHGNILILQKASSDNPYLQPHSSDTRPGVLNPLPVKVIDLGSSQFADTLPIIGNARENWFLIDNVRKILKPLFENGGSLKKWILLEHFKLGGEISTFRIPETNYLPVPRELTSEVFRLLCVMNVLLGHLNSARDNATDDPLERVSMDHTDVAILNQLITGRRAELRDGVFDLDVLTVFKALLWPGGGSDTYVRWQAVIEHWGGMHPGFRKYELHQGEIRAVASKSQRTSTGVNGRNRSLDDRVDWVSGPLR